MNTTHYPTAPTAQPIAADIGIGAPVSKVSEVWDAKPVVVTETGWKDDFAPYTIKTYFVEA